MELDETEAAAVSEMEGAEDTAGAARASTIAAEIPPAREPLTPTNIQLLEKNLGDVVGLLSGGEVPALPPSEVPPDGLDQVPAPLYAALAAVERFLAEVGAPEELRFSAKEAVTSNEGLSEASAKLAALAKTPNIKDTLRPKGEAPAPPPKESSVGRAVAAPQPAQKSAAPPVKKGPEKPAYSGPGNKAVSYRPPKKQE